MKQEIKEVNFIKKNKEIYMKMIYNDNSKYTKKLNEKDKDSLLYTLINILIIND